MNSSVKFFDPMMTFLPSFAGFDSMTFESAVLVDVSLAAGVDVVLSSSSEPQAESASEATITTSALIRFMRFPSFDLRAVGLWVSLPSAAGRSHRPRRLRALLRRLPRQVVRHRRRPAR